MMEVHWNRIIDLVLRIEVALLENLFEFLSYEDD